MYYAPGMANSTIPFFHCNLIQNSFLHRNFLERIHEVGVSLSPLPYESLRRYRDLWLPLVRRYQGRCELIPPPDIAWLWHCHRLAPSEYVKYSTERFGIGSMQFLEACPPFAFQTAQEQSLEQTCAFETRSLWQQAYGNEPFFLLQNNTLPNAYTEEDRVIGGFDLLGSTKRQATFLWQVSGEQFGDMEFLKQGLNNYLKFLRLGRKAAIRGLILVPTFQIDLMWHTHILSSVTLYDLDCQAIMGTTFHHDDTHSEKKLGGILQVSYRDTKQLWMEEYGEDYAVAGGIYRGEPPAAFYNSSWTLHKHSRGKFQISPPVEMESSSTSPPLLQNWAFPKGEASDGSPAFIKVTAIRRKDLKDLPKREKYVLGWTNVFGFGYYHFETREANTIIEKRMETHCKYLESNIAMERSCCGNTHLIGNQEVELADAKSLLVEMRARSRAKCPSGVVRSAAKDKAWMVGSNALYTELGVWLYPPIIWNNCGGGCGGTVANSLGAGDRNS
jgi:hypothetical protein